MEITATTLDSPADLDLIARLWSRQPFDRIDNALLATVAPRLVLRRLHADELIATKGTAIGPLYFICDGRVRLAKGGIRLAELVSGEAFPLEALAIDMKNDTLSCDYVSVGETLCFELPRTEIARLQQDSPSFGDYCRFRSISFSQREQRPMSDAPHAPDTEKTLGHFVHDAALPVVDAQRTIRETALAMHNSRADAVVVADPHGSAIGTFSLQDMLHRVVVAAANLDGPVSKVMTPNPIQLPAASSAFAAAIEMAQSGARHVVVTDGCGIVGLVSDSQLSRNTAEVAHVRDRLYCALTIDALVNIAPDIAALGRNLANEGLDALRLTSIVSTLNDQLTARVIELAASAHRVPMRSFCWLALGSEGRHEQTLCTDQDNAILFEADASNDLHALRKHMTTFALTVNEALARCGFPLCKGGIMASNPNCCITLEEAQRGTLNWLTQPEPEALLNATIHFDFRPLCGNAALADNLRQWLAKQMSGGSHARFLALMTGNALERKPPIGFFRDFVLDKADGCIDLKTQGSAIFVDAARILSLGTSALPANPGTVTRLRSVATTGKFHAKDIDDWIAAFRHIQTLRIRANATHAAKGVELSNRINPYALNNLDRKTYLEALRTAERLQKTVELSYGAKSF